jgi:DNA-binding beta-propeller fold protein YncE
VNHRLFFANGAYNRVLVFNLDSTNNLASRTAAFVLGQPDFTSVDAHLTQSGLYNPHGLAYDSTNSRLFVADQNANRVMVFDVTPGTTVWWTLMNARFAYGADTIEIIDSVPDDESHTARRLEEHILDLQYDDQVMRIPGTRHIVSTAAELNDVLSRLAAATEEKQLWPLLHIGRMVAKRAFAWPKATSSNGSISSHPSCD